MSTAATPTRPPVGTRPDRGGSRGPWRWSVLAVATVVVVPVVVVAASVLTPTTDVWRHLWATRLPSMLTVTIGLLVGVATGTLLLGAGLAWLVTAYRFPARGLLAWLLVLPLAMPAYVLGFVYLALLDHPGPVQTLLRAMFGPGVWFPEVRSLAGVTVVLSLSLYPYVYVLARAAVLEQVGSTLDAARSLGGGPLRAARRVVLPLARPSLAAGLALVMMETLTDFATVQYFNVETVSVGVYRVWRGMFDRAAASELAALVLLFALVVLGIERWLRGRAAYEQGRGAAGGVEPVRLRGWRAGLATTVCTSVLLAAFALPAAQLVAWLGLSRLRGAEVIGLARAAEYLTNSAVLAGVTAACCVAAALVIGHGARLEGGPLARRAARLSQVGYAVPGPVVAVGVLVLFTGLDGPLEALGLPGTGSVVTGSIVGVTYAYFVRFLAVAYSSVDASLEKVPPSMTQSALSLGATPLRLLRRVHLPLVRSGVGVGLALVAVDALKELPIVLLLRPFGFETLSVWTWQLAAESRWHDAALPALLIVTAATVPVLLLFRGGTVPTAKPARTAGLPEEVRL